MEDIPIMVLINQMDLRVGKTLCQETYTAMDTWLEYANRYFFMIPNETEEQYLGFLMLSGTLIKLEPDLNYAAITKEIRNDFEYGEARTDIALNSYSENQVTLRSVAIIFNQHKANIEILKQVYQTNGAARNVDTGGTTTNSDDHQQKMIRAFKKRFRDLCGE